MDFTISGLIASACNHQTALVSVLMAVGGGSVLAWFKKWLPAPVVHVANILGLNWDTVAVAAYHAVKDEKSSLAEVKAGPVAALLLAVALGLSACSTAPSTTGIANPVQTLAQFTVTDLQAASADAHASNDVAAYQCYDYLAKVVPTIQPTAPAGTVGAFLAFQKARDLANGLNRANAGLSQLNLACAPLVIDAQTTINKLALLGVGAASTGGVLLPLAPGLNAAIGASVP